MKISLLTFGFASSLLAASQASAHPGHFAGLTGHDHWIAAGAIGAAAAVGLWALVKGRRKAHAAAAEDAKQEDNHDAQET
jgi:hypothetical protein